MSPAGGGESGSNPLFQFLPFILLFAVIYFLLLRPQQKKQKEHQKMISELTKGERVVTNSGILGTIVGINEKDNIIVLRIAENVKIEVLKSSVGGKVQN
ncbi:MAG: preprotein translocase subunit YajC [candidate division Zixibacteria bacterium]|nr:preprotein translocase subunit YajC [candidate division Zixibacteria bacterium]